MQRPVSNRHLWPRENSFFTKVTGTVPLFPSFSEWNLNLFMTRCEFRQDQQSYFTSHLAETRARCLPTDFYLFDCFVRELEGRCKRVLIKCVFYYSRTELKAWQKLSSYLHSCKKAIAYCILLQNNVHITKSFTSLLHCTYFEYATCTSPTMHLICPPPPQKNVAQP